MRAWIAIYLKGLCMGAADMIPGVSGGTIALIVGIYERLVRAIAAIDPRMARDLLHLHRPAGRQRLRTNLVAIDLPFLLLLGAGIGTAVLGLSRIIIAALEAYPAEVNAFFFGLIGASAVIIFRDVTIDTPGRALIGFVGFTIAFVLSGAAADGLGASLPIVFIAGAIAISAMILPGISGAAFLYILGQYEHMLDALRTVTDGAIAFLTGGTESEFAEASLVVATFLVGAVIGLLTTARIVSWALARYRIATLAFLVSLMVGALRLPIEEAYAAVGVPSGLEWVGILFAAGIGAGLVLGLDRATGSLEYVDTSTDS